jgi:NAD(P)H-hydrate epimerase
VIPVLSRAQMRAFDAYAIQTCAVPSLVLMENAGRGATEILVRELLGGDVQGAHILVVCGTGNNGGDGFVVARHLLGLGAEPVVYVLGDTARLTPDARANLDAWRGLDGPVREGPADTLLAQLAAELAEADAVVDALFGTGLDRPIEGPLADAVRAVNDSTVPCFALDVPSGLDAETGAELGVAIRAQATATFAHEKLGLLTPNGSLCSGRVHVVDIGVPAALVAHVGSSGQLLQPADLALWLAPRSPGQHKNSSGHVAVVAGSPGKIGAPQLAARGAMRAGAGLTTIATWPDAARAIESHVLEIMTARIDPERPGESLDQILEGKHAVVIGPGFGLGDEARAAVEHVVASFGGPTVVDADALTLFAGRPSTLMASKKAILTPHPGEAARLLGRSPAQIEENRFHASRELAAASGAVVVLKGAHTIIAAPDGRLAVSPVACPALATAGAGDVLGGIVAAVACSLPPFDAACAGVMLHALAGEAWSKSHGDADRGMLASEIADTLPQILAAHAKA